MDFFLSILPLRFILFLLIAVPCSLSDQRTGFCSRVPLLALIILMVSTSLFDEYPLISFSKSLTGSFAGMASFYAARKLTGGGLGLADVWMAGAIGALGGPAYSLRATAVAIGVVSASSILKKTQRNSPLPFLPYLVLGCVLSEFFFIF